MPSGQKGSAPSRRHSEYRGRIDALNNSVLDDDERAQREADLQSLVPPLPEDDLEGLVPPQDFSAQTTAVPLRERDYSEQPPAQDAGTVPDAVEPPDYLTKLASLDPNTGKPAVAEPEAAYQPADPVPNPPPAAPPVEVSEPVAPPPPPSNGLEDYQNDIVKRYARPDLEQPFQVAPDAPKAGPAPLVTPPNQGQSAPKDDLEEQLGHARDFEAQKHLISGFGQAGEMAGAAFSGRKANLDAFKVSTVGDDSRKSLENLMQLRQKAALAVKKGADGKPLDPRKDKDSDATKYAKMNLMITNPKLFEQLRASGALDTATADDIDKAYKGVNPAASREQHSEEFKRTFDFKAAQAGITNKFKQHGIDFAHEMQSNIFVRKALSSTEDHATKTAKFAPMVATLEQVYAAAPKVMSIKLPDGTNFMDMDILSVAKKMAGSIATQFSTDEQNAFDVAYRRLISQDIHSLAGATFTPSEETRLSAMYNDSAMASPAARMIFVKLLSDETQRRVAAQDAGLRAFQKNPHVGPAAQDTVKYYFDEPGVISGVNAKLGWGGRAVDPEMDGVTAENPFGNSGAPTGPEAPAAPPLPMRGDVKEVSLDQVPPAQQAAFKGAPGPVTVRVPPKAPAPAPAGKQVGPSAEVRKTGRRQIQGNSVRYVDANDQVLWSGTASEDGT